MSAVVDGAERILVLAPTAADAALSRAFLSEAGFKSQICSDLSAAGSALAESGALLMTEDALRSTAFEAMLRALRSQAPWSDIPVLLLSSAGADSAIVKQAMELLSNITVLERPVRITTLISGLRTAIRSRRRQYELRDRIEAMRQTDRRKDEFLATLAHELRNPLAPIRNALQILRLSRGDEQLAEQAHSMMERQTQQMVRLIDDLLDVSRITQGKLELRLERVALDTVIRNAVETARPLIHRNNHELMLDLPQQSLYLDADPVRLAQVFSNLLNNAAKYMQPGGSIWVKAEQTDAGVQVSIRDAGIGIPERSLSSIFDMFTQVDSSLEKTQGGLGIGLTLVRQLVEMHWGEVMVRSEGLDKGSEFIVSLPTAGGVIKAAQEDASLQQGGGGPGDCCRVLVADDNIDAAESMKLMLELSGHEVSVVHDGRQALAEAERFRPHLALLDIGMPHLNGHEVARAIRAADWGRDMILVALTGWGQAEDKRRSQQAGFDRHFTKPVDPQELQGFMSGMQVDSRRSAALSSAAPG